MNIPSVTKEKPYIEFRIDKKGKIKLRSSSSWWGGKNGGFISSGGVIGNTCKPNRLNEYIEARVKKEIKSIEKEMASLNKRSDCLSKLLFILK